MKCKELSMPFKTAVQARWNEVAALRVAGYTEG